MVTQRPTPTQNLGVARSHPTHKIEGIAPVYLQEFCRPVYDSGWQSYASFPFCWQTLSSPCKHLDFAAPCIFSCCSFYLEFTSLADSIVIKELHAFALKLLKTDLFHFDWTGSASE